MEPEGSHADPLVHEARRKFSSALESNVLDYLHYAPAVLEACVATIEKIFGNALDNPDDEKFRRIKIASKTYQAHIASVKHAEELLLQTGWRPQVVDLQRFMVLDAKPGSTGWAVLAEARDVLVHARSTLHEKAERKRVEREQRLGRESEERHKILVAIEADRAERVERQQMAAAAAADVAAAEAAAAAAAAAAAQQQQDGGGGGEGGAGSPRSPGAAARRRGSGVGS
ncbi:MAG: hypothetical protein J3K34DRAFT_28503 [Monoraphidium minutum]|nr:MAG: hypothetical protein J3K34DRAFT_28503 [Monoraphidium minutum]